MHAKPPANPTFPPGQPSGGGGPPERHSETRAQRNERIFQALPALGSPAYLELLKIASAEQFPAEVLVRAYRQLKTGPAADATLVRLVAQDNKYGYLDVLYSGARKRITADDAYSIEDLVYNAVGEIVLTLGGPKGQGADTAWVSFCRQRLADAHRGLIGRHAERRPPIERPHRDRTTGEEWDPVDSATTAPWHGSVAPDKIEWLEDFIRRTLARIPDERIREVGLNLLRANPLPIS